MPSQGADYICNHAWPNIMSIRPYILSLTAAFGIALAADAGPARAAIINCTGNSNLGSIATGSGANCGFLNVGDTFRLNITPFFSGLGTKGFNSTPIGIGMVTSGGSPVSFNNFSVVATGVAGGKRFTLDKPGIFGAGPINGFGSAANTSFTYTPNGSRLNSFGGFTSVNFAFGSQGAGGFSSLTGSPDGIGLTEVEEVLIVGRLASVGNTFSNNIVSFGVGPAGKLTPGSTFAGNFRTGGQSTTEVPGPLPIAGAGAAFAWSRRLRRRLKLAGSSGPVD